MDKLFVVIPCFNEENNIPILYFELKRIIPGITNDYELVFINDGSSDSTKGTLGALSIQDPHVKVINLSRNFGYEAAVKAGLDNIQGELNDYIIIMDADMQDPPSLVFDLWNSIHSGYDIVLAKRKSRSDGFIKDKSAWLFYRIINKFSKLQIPQDVGYFRIFSGKVLKEIQRFTEYSLFLKGVFSYVGFKVHTIEYLRPQRLSGHTKISYKKLISLATDGIVSFSTVPLQWVMIIGIICAGVSFIIGIIQIILKLTNPESYQYGISTLVVLLAFIAGIQLLSLGILGIYIGKIYEETKKRPLYIVDKTD